MSTLTKIDHSPGSILSNAAALLLGSAIAQGATSIALLLMARQLGPGQFGQYSSSIVLVSFASIVFNLGLDLWLLKEGGSNPSKTGELVSSVFATKLLIGLIWVGFFFWITPITDSSTFPTNIVRLAALTVWLNSLIASALTSFKMVLRNKISAVFESTLNLLWLITTLVLIYFSVRQAVGFLIARTLLLAAGSIGSITLVWFTFRGQPNRKTIIEALQQSPAYAASEFLVLLFMRMDVLIVALILGEFEAGLYSPAVGVINVLLLVPVALYQVILPLLSSLFSTDSRKAWQASRRFAGLFLILGAFLSLGIFFGSDLLTLILGGAFIESQYILKLLSPILFLHSITFAVAAILVATNQQAKRTSIQVVAVAADALLNLILLPRLGIEGAAIAYVISEILLLAGYCWLVIRFQKDARALEVRTNMNPGAP